MSIVFNTSINPPETIPASYAATITAATLEPNTMLVMHYSDEQTNDVNLVVTRVAGKVMCEDCENYGHSIPCAIFGVNNLGKGVYAIKLTLPGKYLIQGDPKLNSALYDPCNPVILEVISAVY